MKNPYRSLGIGLVIGGALFTPLAYFLLENVPLTAVGLSTIMIGFTSFALANSRPDITPEAGEAVLRAGMENIAALIEELGLQSPAIYFPSGMRSGKPQAVIPLTSEATLKLHDQPVVGRLIVRYGSRPEEIGIAVTTPGSIPLEQLPSRPGNTPDELETSIIHVLTGILDLADNASVRFKGNSVEVKVNGFRLHYEDAYYYRCLGSPVASIVATLTGEALQKPVRIADEKHQGKKSTILIETASGENAITGD